MSDPSISKEEDAEKKERDRNQDGTGERYVLRLEEEAEKEKHFGIYAISFVLLILR